MRGKGRYFLEENKKGRNYLRPRKETLYSHYGRYFGLEKTTKVTNVMHMHWISIK